jgi:hypothetical protein
MEDTTVAKRGKLLTSTAQRPSVALEPNSRLAAVDKVASLIEAQQARLAYTIPEAVSASGLSRSMLYVAIGRGSLQARKCGARTLILDSDLRAFLRDLPPFSNSDAAPGDAA